MIDIIRSFLKGLATPCLLFLACLGVGMVLHTLGYLLFKGFRKKELRSIAFILCCVVATFYGGSKGIRHVTRPPQSNPTDQEGSGTPTQLDTQGQVAFRVVDIALSNDCFTVKTAWTNGLFAAGAKLDYLVKTNLNDEVWTWNGYETVAEGVTNSTHTITLTDFATTVQGADNVAYYVLPSSFFVRVVPRLPVSDMTE